MIIDQIYLAIRDPHYLTTSDNLVNVSVVTLIMNILSLFDR